MSIDPDRLRELTEPDPTRDWTREREDAVLHRLQAHADRPRRVPVFAVAAAVAAALVAFWLGARWFSPPDGSTESVATSTFGTQPLQFRDGTSITPLSEHTEVIVASASEDLTEVQLRRGGARFDVTPDPRRKLRVDAGLVTVEVLGTEFDIERDGDRVAVRVLRGSVRVSWPRGSRVLTRGDAGTFPPLHAAATTAVPVDAATQELPPPSVPPVPPEATTPPDGPPSAKRATKQRRPETAEVLMKAADDARKAGDPAAAVAKLELLLRDHPDDPQADLAAFTIGRIEMSTGHYRVAAGYFARVRKSGRTSLAEHALAREVQAWWGAGDRGKTQERANEYLSRYPDGPRAEQVRRIADGAGG